MRSISSKSGVSPRERNQAGQLRPTVIANGGGWATQQGLPPKRRHGHLKDPVCAGVEVALYVSPEDEKRRLEAFEDEVIDRLFVLNAERAEQERVLGLGSGSKKKKASRKGDGGKKGVH